MRASPDPQHRLLQWALCVACLLTACISPAAEQSSDAAVKAAYLHRFTGYTQWPDETKNVPWFTFAIFGDTTVASELERLLTARSIKDKPARVIRPTSVSEIGDAQVLFIGSNFSSAGVKKIIAALANRPVLVVTDDLHGIETGSSINFVQSNRRVRFEVSLAAAKQAHIDISSDLLGVAARVVEAP